MLQPGKRDTYLWCACFSILQKNCFLVGNQIKYHAVKKGEIFTFLPPLQRNMHLEFRAENSISILYITLHLKLQLVAQV